MLCIFTLMGAGASTTTSARTPGRVNLIGDHTDYTGGLVLPMAIDRYTQIVARPLTGAIALTSTSEPEALHLTLPVDDAAGVQPAWGRYVAGVAHQMSCVDGIEGLIETTIPLGAGLSSSAALEIATALILGSINGLPAPTAIELAQLCRRAEHVATGVPCGIMDQLTCTAGVKGHALLIDCHSMQVSPIQIPDGVHVYVQFVAHRQLASSAYAERVAQCNRAEFEIGPLRLAEVGSVRNLSDEVLRRRALHVVGENERVRRATVALAIQDLATFGQLMNESHLSLRDNFEVSTPQMDAAVDTARTIPGVFGARMTGGGFGGCIVIVADATANLKHLKGAMLVKPVGGAEIL